MPFILKNKIISIQWSIQLLPANSLYLFFRRVLPRKTKLTAFSSSDIMAFCDTTCLKINKLKSHKGRKLDWFTVLQTGLSTLLSQTNSVFIKDNF